MSEFQQPDLIASNYLEAERCMNEGRYAEAKVLFQGLLSNTASKSEVLHNLSLISLAENDLSAALDYERQAHLEMPKYLAYISNLAELERRCGNLSHALEWAKKAIELDPCDVIALYNFGNIALDFQNYQEAQKAFLEAISHQPKHGLAWNNLGSARQQLGDYEGALEAYTMATQINPDHAEAQCNKGFILFQRADLSAAKTATELALLARPNFPEAKQNLKYLLGVENTTQYHDALANLALKFQKVNHHIAVIELLQSELISQVSSDAMAHLWHLLGISCYRINRFSDARHCYQTAIAMAPRFAGALNSLGFLLQDLRLYEDARQAFEDAVRIDPNFDMARLNLGMIQLKLGLWQAGWENYEYRWTGSAEAISQTQKKPNLPLPLWDGVVNERNKALLVMTEQGFGDTLQFCRYLPTLKPQFEKIAVQVPNSLRRLLEWSLTPQIEVLSELPNRLDAWTSYIPLLSLPRVLKTTLDSMPPSHSYLTVPNIFSDFWKRRLQQQTRGRLKIGIAWSGRKTLQYDLRRSIPFAKLAPLFTIDGVDWICLQKWDQDIDQSLLNQNHWFDWTNELNDFADTAALIQNLDLVVSIDSAVAHLAGALHRPVYLLNRFDGEWRWLCNQTRSPWYPTMTIFNQSEFADWGHVIEEVKNSILGFTPALHRST